jgi:DNA-binding protein Fis
MREESVATEQTALQYGKESLNGAEKNLIHDSKLISAMEKYSIEEIVEVKISKFLDKIGSFYPENLHDLIMSKVEKPLLSQILKRVGGNQVQASKILGINRNTLRKKIKQYHISF